MPQRPRIRNRNSILKKILALAILTLIVQNKGSHASFCTSEMPSFNLGSLESESLVPIAAQGRKIFTENRERKTFGLNQSKDTFKNNWLFLPGKTWWVPSVGCHLPFMNSLEPSISIFELLFYFVKLRSSGRKLTIKTNN